MVGLRVIAGLLAFAALQPVAAGPTTRQLVETVDISGVTISPDGRFTAYRQEEPSIDLNTVKLYWMVVANDGRTPPRRIADGGDPIYRDNGILAGETPIWSPGGDSLFYRALVDGAVQVWRAAADGSGAQRVAPAASDVDRFALIDRGRLVIEAGPTRSDIVEAEQREYEQGIILDRSIEAGQAIYRGGLINGRRATQRLSGDWYDRRGLLGDAARHYETVDLRTGGKRASSASERASFDEVQRGRLAINSAPNLSATAFRTGWVATLSVGGEERLIVTDPAHGGRAKVCPRTACGRRVRWAAWLPDGRELAIATFAPASGWTLNLWQPASNRVKTAYSGTAMVSGDWTPVAPCSLDVRLIVCVAAGASTPPQLIAIDPARGGQHILASPNWSTPLAVTKTISWTDQDGVQFSAEYFQPARRNGGDHPPLFVTYNSCTGYIRGASGDEFPLAALADHGIAGLCIYSPYRLEPIHYDALGTYRTALSGIRAIVTKLGDAGEIDPARVGMGGLSFSSEVTAWVLSHSDLLAAVSLSSALLEPAYYWMNVARNPNIRDNLAHWWGLKAPDVTPDRWREVATASRVGAIHAPILFQLPEQEYRTNLELIGRLMEAGKPVETIIFPEEAHVKAQPRHKYSVYERNLDWFLFWLKNEKRSTSSQDQYARWDRLRPPPVQGR